MIRAHPAFKTRPIKNKIKFVYLEFTTRAMRNPRLARAGSQRGMRRMWRMRNKDGGRVTRNQRPRAAAPETGG